MSPVVALALALEDVLAEVVVEELLSVEAGGGGGGPRRVAPEPSGPDVCSADRMVSTASLMALASVVVLALEAALVEASAPVVPDVVLALVEVDPSTASSSVVRACSNWSVPEDDEVLLAPAAVASVEEDALELLAALGGGPGGGGGGAASEPSSVDPSVELAKAPLICIRRAARPAAADEVPLASMDEEDVWVVDVLSSEPEVSVEVPSASVDPELARMWWWCVVVAALLIESDIGLSFSCEFFPHDR